MSATPTNKINQDLLIGGDVGCDNVVASVSVRAPLVASSVLNGIITPHGAGFGFTGIEVLVTLDTTGDTTASPAFVGMPVGSVVWGASVYVTDEITVDSLTLTLNVNAGVDPLLTLTKVALDTYPATTADAVTVYPPVPITGLNGNKFTLVLAGGATDTPSTGQVRVVLFVLNTTPLTS